jgi:hypothetical protein
MTRRTFELTELEMVEILKAIAREGGNAAARIAAIKELRAMASGQAPVEDDGRVVVRGVESGSD